MTAAVHPMMARSAAPDVRNPLLKLSAAARMQHLAESDRRMLRAALDSIRRDAKRIGDQLWLRGRDRHAAYWRACSVYAGHAARLAHPKSSTVSALADPVVPRGPNPVSRLAAASLEGLPAAAVQALRELLIELAEEARVSKLKSWKTSKAPMAVYWADVSVVARHCARAVHRLEQSGDANDLRLAA